MKIEYDREADALYVMFRSCPVDHSREIEGGVVVDFDAQDHVIGVEVLDASHRLSPEELTSAEIRGLTG